jgi:hypothetical protein
VGKHGSFAGPHRVSVFGGLVVVAGQVQQAVNQI